MNEAIGTAAIERDELFDVWQFFPDDTYEKVRERIPAKEAVEAAKSLTTRPAAMMGVIRRVIITDDGDHTVFEWISGEGVVFPPR